MLVKGITMNVSRSDFTENELRDLCAVLQYDFTNEISSAELATSTDLVDYMERDPTIVINDGGVIYTSLPTNEGLNSYKEAVQRDLNKSAHVKITLQSVIDSARSDGLELAGEEAKLSDSEKNEVSDITDQILEAGNSKGASDIHLRLNSRGATIEFRESAFLVPHGELSLPLDMAKRLFTHLLNKAKDSTNGEMDLNKIINGGFENTIEHEKHRFRISFQPLSEGQKHHGVHVSEAVIRILPKVGEKSIDLKTMKLPPRFVDTVKRCIAQKAGAIILGGPTGSGKTTLAHGALSLVQPGRKVNTIEDPIEIVNKRFRQTEIVHTDNGITFEDAIRNILRQDSDVVLVGEIRTQEAAKLSAQVALNGHLLLATLHIGRVSEAFSYLHHYLGLLPIQIGSESFSTLWVCQRLATKVCPSCAISFLDEPNSERKKQAIDVMEHFKYPTHNLRFRNENGCPDCNKKGAAGLTDRIPVIEYIELDNTCRDFVMGSDIVGMMKYLEGQGWESMPEHAALLVANGYLSIDTATLEVGSLSIASLGGHIHYEKNHEYISEPDDFYASLNVKPRGAETNGD